MANGGVNRFIRGADGTTLDVGDVQAMGAPAITGSFTLRPVVGGSGKLTHNSSGALTESGGSAGSAYGPTTTSTSFDYSSVSIDAADSPGTGASAAYDGTAEEVRPDNIALLPCIVF